MSEHYYTQTPQSKSDKKSFDIHFKGHDLSFVTDAGVFSKGELDKGSALLLATMPTLTGEVLDMGCGWGAIGITLMKMQPHLSLTMVDINSRALALTRENLVLNGLHAQTLQSNGFEGLSEQRFMAIVTNPPIRAGKQVIYGMFRDAKPFLLPEGALYIVIRKQQGAESAIRFLKTLYSRVEVLKKGGGFYVVKASNQDRSQI